ncbi:MAG: hypothetical protein JNK11_11510 [Alphaproteobacteria bacterium]|nr:hypothetical protein [Alphaproteobacteria bacterium]
MSGSCRSDPAQAPGMLREVLAEHRIFRSVARAVKADLRDLAARALSLDATIDDYGQAVVGEGSLASGLEERARRIERHLGIAEVRR